MEAGLGGTYAIEGGKRRHKPGNQAEGRSLEVPVLCGGFQKPRFAGMTTKRGKPGENMLCRAALTNRQRSITHTYGQKYLKKSELFQYEPGYADGWRYRLLISHPECGEIRYLSLNNTAHHCVAECLVHHR